MRKGGNVCPSVPPPLALSHLLQGACMYIRKNQLFLLHLITSYSSYFEGKKGISGNKTSFFLLMHLALKCSAPSLAAASFSSKSPDKPYKTTSPHPYHIRKGLPCSVMLSKSFPFCQCFPAKQPAMFSNLHFSLSI